MKCPDKIVVLLALCFCATGFAWAESAEHRFQPVEMYQCNFKKGEDRSRFDRIIPSWNKWMDIYYGEAYRAWALSPDFNDPDSTFDLTWIGAWKDGRAMGHSQDNWAEKGDEQMAIFMSILDCPIHASMAAEQLVRGTAENADKSVVSFRDCTVAEGKTVDEAIDAVRAFANYMAQQGSKASQWVFYPVWGPTTDVSFNWVEIYPNYTQLGADFERYGNGGAYKKADELLMGTVDCRHASISRATKVREANVDN